MIILLDARGGAENFLKAKQGALKVLETLNSRDEANVIVFGGMDATLVQAGATTMECHSEQLLKMTEENGAILAAFVKGIAAPTEASTNTADAAVDYTALFAKTNAFLPPTYTASDGSGADSDGSGDVNGASDRNTAILLISMYSGSADASVSSASFAPALGGTALFAYTPLSTGGVGAAANVHHLIDAATVGVLPALYHEDARMQSKMDVSSPIASALYADYSGMGLVTTMALPLARCSFSDGCLHSRMPLVPTLARLKRACV
jgi:hypothetical protein